MKDKKGQGAALGVIAFALVALVVIGAVGMFGGDSIKAVVTGGSDSDDASAGVCESGTSVSLTYNDIDRYTPGSDPGAGNLYVTDGPSSKGTNAEGAITMTPAASFSGLAAESATAVFSEPVDFQTTCSNMDLEVEVVKAGAPTITLINSNGVTENSDANHEDMGADQEYDFEMTVKAPSKQCASRHGALLVADFDKTFVQSVGVNELSGGATPGYLSHQSAENSTLDGFTTFVYNGELCNGAKAELTGSIETTSEAIDEGEANIVWHWVPLDYDIDQDTLEILGPAAEDEDSNAITLGNTTQQYYTA